MRSASKVRHCPDLSRSNGNHQGIDIPRSPNPADGAAGVPYTRRSADGNSTSPCTTIPFTARWKSSDLGVTHLAMMSPHGYSSRLSGLNRPSSPP